MSDTQKLVTLDRLKTLLDAYGAMPDRWPAEERAAAQTLIETSSEARRLVEQAASLDSLLDKVPEPEVSAALTSRVMSMALPVAPQKQPGLLSWLADYFRPRTSRGWQGAVAMAGVLGMVAGVGMSQMMLDRTAPLQRAVATSAPVTAPVPVLDSLPASALPVAATTEATAVSLEPSTSNISLTGEDIAVNAADDPDGESEIGEYTVAGVPLY